jgi:hypothetical protein
MAKYRRFRLRPTRDPGRQFRSYHIRGWLGGGESVDFGSLADEAVDNATLTTLNMLVDRAAIVPHRARKPRS